MKRTFKLFAMLILLCLISLSVYSQNVTLTNAVSSNTGEYEEQISLEISPYSGQVLLAFSFTGVNGPPIDTADLEGDPSFIRAGVGGTHSPDDNRTTVSVTLGSVGVSEGKLFADSICAKFENIFDVTIPYSSNISSEGTVMYFYRVDQCSIQKFRDYFLEYKPSHGFGEIVTPALIGNYVSIMFDLKKEDAGLIWTAWATINYPNYFEKRLGQEYTISLKELTGYSEPIQSSPESSKSSLSILIGQVDKEYKLISLKTTPSMEKTQGTYGAVTTFMFQKTITGSSVEDFSIQFKIVSPNYIDPTIIAMVGIPVVAILGIIGFIIRKKRKLKQYG